MPQWAERLSDRTQRLSYRGPLLAIALRLSLFLHGHRPRRWWQSFGRAVNQNPRAGRGPHVVPGGDGTAHVVKTGCPSLRNRRTGELVILHQAGPREARIDQANDRPASVIA